ncbi:protein mono-ADP-ribosyltransferase PARP9 [Gambusia affinis]|uniref:protein mono-ADP-ribosyltransferase PARP9 n=1 Tax=Gambusia affinis TaxID=33528 RepID=UPI001CDB6A3C|nr:protein mono-ADP-ribosyltransferase PARP9 [Gambusia affinis]XP_043988459.1 protein mono-ADP-ribosyltransferase PARP9 [Gambusia affinis]
MASKLDIPLYEASLSIVRRCGADVCEIINSKFGCVATIEGVENESRTSYQRPPAIIKPEIRLEVMMRSGVKVSVWKADLTNFPAEAVVNAANEDLKHYGGLALALSTAGGPKIQQESDDYIKKRGKLQTGEAVALGPGSLPCKTIIHAVGPNLSPSPSQQEVQRATALLERAILNILNKVDEYQLATVAIPAISSGLFHYPLRECADTIVSTIKAFYDKLPKQYHRPKEIFLANHDDPTVQEMERACNQIFRLQQKQTYSSAAAQNTQRAGNAPQASVKIGNVLLTLQKGKIEEQNTDVIVNTASEERKLSQGQISKAILEKAGYEIQKDMYKAVKKGNIYCTNGYNLKCKQVYHAICTGQSRSPTEWTAPQQLLYSSVYECLVEATKNQHSSISFPAIGTGNLGFLKETSASIMSKAVAEFAERSQSKLDVYFVIFPLDYDTYQAFEAEIKALQERVSNFMLATASGSEDFHTSRASTPKITLLGPSDESKREAKKWFTDLLYRHKPIQIRNNFISHFSEEDHQALAHLADTGLSIEEFFSKGHACLTVNGKPEENAVIAALQVEVLLCKIHKDFIAEEEHQLKMLTAMKVSGEKKTVDEKSPVFSQRIQLFRPEGLWMVKVDRVENDALKEMFDRKKKQLHRSSTKTMFQRIPAQFCEMISRIGFHAECAPPEDPTYGEGIYFARSIKAALELWREKGEEYLYFVEADVLLGNSAKGERGFILPPPDEKDPNTLCDSVSGGSDVSVIFSGYQALPKYIITCKNSHSH